MLEVIAPRVGEALERDRGRSRGRSRRRSSARGSTSWSTNEAEGRERVRALLEAAANPPEAIERILPSLEDVFIHHVERAEAERRGVPS